MFRHTFVSILLSNPNIGVATVIAEAGHAQPSTTLAIYTQIIHAIEAHHGDVEPKTPLAFIIQAADAISAARPGARRENVESYVKRLENLEEISSSFEGVEQAFAVQAGREVRIMVKPDVISDDQVILLARSIAKKIEDTLDYPGQIKVNVIRESRAVEYAK